MEDTFDSLAPCTCTLHTLLHNRASSPFADEDPLTDEERLSMAADIAAGVKTLSLMDSEEAASFRIEPKNVLVFMEKVIDPSEQQLSERLLLATNGDSVIKPSTVTYHRKISCKLGDQSDGSLSPTPLNGKIAWEYVCPEELLGEVSPGEIFSSGTGQLYSLAVVVNELLSGDPSAWHGVITASTSSSAHANSQLKTKVQQALREGLRPRLVEKLPGGSRIPSELVAVIQRAWSDNRENRGTALRFQAQLECTPPLAKWWDEVQAFIASRQVYESSSEVQEPFTPTYGVPSTPVTTAASSSNSLASSKSYPKPVTGYGQMILAAAELGIVNAVESLLVLTPDGLALSDSQGRTAMHWAAERGHTDVVEFLTSVGASVHVYDNNSFTPLHRAAANGHVDVIKVLLKAKADVNVMGGGIGIGKGSAPLHWAAQNCQTEAIRTLISAGATVDIRSSHVQSTPLHWAAEHGCVDAIDVLVKAGASLSIATVSDHTPLFTAAWSGQVSAIQALVKAGASLEAPLVCDGAMGGLSNEISVRRGFFRRITGENKQKLSRITPLHHAAAIGRMEALNSLIEAGAKVNVVDDNGRTPLHAAAEIGHADAVAALIAAGASVKVTDRKKLTPLHLAAENGNVVAVRALLSAGASLKDVDRKKNTPIMIAEKCGHVDVVTALQTAAITSGKSESCTIQ